MLTVRCEIIHINTHKYPYFSELVANGYLLRGGKGKGTWYSLA